MFTEIISTPTICCYSYIPSELNVVELLEAGSEDSYVFSAPETIE